MFAEFIQIYVVEIQYANKIEFSLSVLSEIFISHLSCIRHASVNEHFVITDVRISAFFYIFASVM